MRTRQVLKIINTYYITYYLYDHFISHLLVKTFLAKHEVYFIVRPRSGAVTVGRWTIGPINKCVPHWTRPEHPEQGPVLIFIFMLNKEFSV